MYVLINYNNYVEKNLEELKKYNFTPIIIFNIIFNNKNQIKRDLEKISIQKKNLLEKYPNLNLYFSILINLEKFDNNFANIINNLKSDFNIIMGQGGLNKENTFFIENTKIDFLVDPQSSDKKTKIDFIHHLNSGLNHLLCRYAKEKEIQFIYTLNNISNKKDLKQLGRINQNIKFNRKYENKININFIINQKNQIKSKIELNSIYSLFNLSNEQKKDSFSILADKIEENILKQSKNYIRKGIYLN